MKRSSVIARNVADIGSGTGLLAFSALDLCKGRWRSRPISIRYTPVMANNCASVMCRSAVAGELSVVIANGMDHPLIKRGPYDLLIANILAGPLVELARTLPPCSARQQSGAVDCSKPGTNLGPPRLPPRRDAGRAAGDVVSVATEETGPSR
jgi:hypothetical protein